MLLKIPNPAKPQCDPIAVIVFFGVKGLFCRTPALSHNILIFNNVTVISMLILKRCRNVVS